jgi:hypothetical protein
MARPMIRSLQAAAIASFVLACLARPIIYHNRGGTCWQPQLKWLTLMVNSIFNGNRFEDIWLDR